MRSYSTLVAVVMLLILAAAVDWLLSPFHSPTPLLAIPLVTAALYFPPRGVIGVIAVGLLTETVEANLEHLHTLSMALGVGEVALVGLPAIFVASERVKLSREARHFQITLENWRQIVERISDAFLVVDRDGTISYVNHQAAELFRLPVSELEGQNVWAAFPQAYGTIFQQEGRRALLQGIPVSFEAYAPTVDKWLNVRAFPSRSGLSVLFEDVTARKLTDAEKAAELTQAEESQRRLQRFLAMVAHDLRGPITLILGYGQLLRRHFGSTTDESDSRAAATIVKAAEAMRRLVEDLLEASRVGTGQFEIHPAHMDLVPLLQQIADEQQSTTSLHQIVLDLPAHLEGVWDSQRLSEVFTNLVSNAIKYSPKVGRILIRAFASGGIANVCVTDQGIGIAPEHLAHLFEPFYRIPLPAEIRRKGMGLGLYISNAIVVAHHGRIEVTSEPGHGCTFCVELPLNQSAVESARE